MSISANSPGRPFTAKVNELLASGLRYADLEAQLGQARSTAWLNNLVNGDRWRVNPPSQDTFRAFAKLFKTDEADLCRMIAEEWFKTVQSPKSTLRVRALASRLNSLTPGDAQLVEALVQRLQPPFKFDFEIQEQEPS